MTTTPLVTATTWTPTSVVLFSFLSSDPVEIPLADFWAYDAAAPSSYDAQQVLDYVLRRHAAATSAAMERREMETERAAREQKEALSAYLWAGQDAVSVDED